MNMGKFQKVILYGTPLLSLFITSNFPSALCLYWCTANIHSLATAYILKIDRVKKYFDIPDPVVNEKDEDENKARSSIVKIKSAFSGM
jgi:membrane protein insertase Oxa1/YidC/SpoIIIJ